jgi:type IV pilus assembly protein PilF
MSNSIWALFHQARLLVVVMLAIFLSACVTTGDVKPEKWDSKERAESHVELGISYLQRGQFEVAREEIDLAISINPNSDTAYHARGLLLEQTGHTEEAIKVLGRAVQLNRSNYVAVNDYGIVLCQNGDYAKGIDTLLRIEAKLDNKYLSNTRLGLGICYLEQGSLAPAKVNFRLVLEIAPGLLQALFPMAEIAFREQQYLSARAFIERYISFGGLSQEALVLGADTELKLGDTDKAKEYIRELRRVYPNSDQLERYRTLLGGG